MSQLSEISAVLDEFPGFLHFSGKGGSSFFLLHGTTPAKKGVQSTRDFQLPRGKKKAKWKKRKQIAVYQFRKSG